MNRAVLIAGLNVWRKVTKPEAGQSDQKARQIVVNTDLIVAAHAEKS
jgi:hypothetical protein